MPTVSGRISINIAASMKPAPSATRYFRKRSPRRWAPDWIRTSPPRTFAAAASKPNRRIEVMESWANIHAGRFLTQRRKEDLLGSAVALCVFAPLREKSLTKRPTDGDHLDVLFY